MTATLSSRRLLDADSSLPPSADATPEPQPQHRALLGPDSVLHPSGAEVSQRTTSGPSPQSNDQAQTFGDLILIVDDQATNLKMLRQLLADTAYQLTFASSGPQALERAKAVQPDLILLDLLMPGMDGLTVCRHLKADDATADIPVIFLTASHESDHVLQAFDHGAVDYVTKPFRSSELLARIRTHLTLKRTQRELDSLNHHLDGQVQQRTAALLRSLAFAETTQRITRNLRDTLDENQIFATVVEALSDTLELQRCQIAIYDRDRQQSVVAYAYRDGRSSPPNIAHSFTRFSAIYETLRQGQIVQMPLLAGTAQALDHDLGAAAQLLACPLQDHQSVIGDIWLYRPLIRPFSPEEIQLVEQIANHSAIAIRQARLYESSQTQVEELERLNHAKDDFLKTVSHELRTPLTSIKAAADTLQAILQQPNWQEKHQQSIEKVMPLLVDECDREIRLVNTMLEFIHLDVSDDPPPDEVRLKDLIGSITPLYDQRLDAREQTLTVTLAPDLPLLQTNADTLGRVIIELLDNACRYTPFQGEIELTAFFDNRYVGLSVSNSGVALSEKQLDQIFEKFYRLPQHDRWQHGGVGLGLALVEKQVAYLGGHIRATQTSQRFEIQIVLPSQGEKR